jgi:hypothetical protein
LPGWATWEYSARWLPKEFYSDADTGFQATGEQLLEMIVDYGDKGLPDVLVLALGMVLQAATNAASTEEGDPAVPDYVDACTADHHFGFNLFKGLELDDTDIHPTDISRNRYVDIPWAGS